MHLSFQNKETGSWWAYQSLILSLRVELLHFDTPPLPKQCRVAFFFFFFVHYLKHLPSLFVSAHCIFFSSVIFWLVSLLLMATFNDVASGKALGMNFMSACFIEVVKTFCILFLSQFPQCCILAQLMDCFLSTITNHCHSVWVLMRLTRAVSLSCPLNLNACLLASQSNSSFLLLPYYPALFLHHITCNFQDDIFYFRS